MGMVEKIAKFFGLTEKTQGVAQKENAFGQQLAKLYTAKRILKEQIDNLTLEIQQMENLSAHIYGLERKNVTLVNMLETCTQLIPVYKQRRYEFQLEHDYVNAHIEMGLERQSFVLEFDSIRKQRDHSGIVD